MPSKATTASQGRKKEKEESVQNKNEDIDDEVIELERPDNLNEFNNNNNNNNNQVGFARSGDLHPGQIERHIRVDPQTRAQQVYQTDGKGSQMYGYYYNSDNDPKFQQENNKNGRQSHTSCCYYSSSSHSSGQPHEMNMHVPFANPIRSFQNQSSSRHTNRNQENNGPVVEEPDDEDEYDNHNYHNDARSGRSGRELTVRNDMRHDPFAMMHNHMQAMQQQMDDMQARFFGRPTRNNERGHNRSRGMFDAFDDNDDFGFHSNVNNMSNHRNNMFGGHDPFNNFSRW